MPPVYRFLNGLNYSLLPARCVLCENPGMPELDLCEACFSTLPAQPKPLPWAFGSVYAGFLYGSPVDGMIHGFKFHEQVHLGRLLARLCVSALASQRPDALLPIPLHVGRLRQRGFNQSLELARYWARHRALPVLSGALVRHRETAVQSSLSAAARETNVRGAFQVKMSLPPHVALVDDVFTTGATCKAAAEALYAAGAQRVDVWCLARVL